MTDETKLRRAGVERDNAYRDFALTLHKVMAPMLALTKGAVLVPGAKPGSPAEVLELLIPQAPVQMHDMLRNMQVAQKQLEIGLIILVDMLTKAEVIDMADYLTQCGKNAEDIEKVLHRGLLSGGAAIGPHSGAMIRPPH